MKYQAMHWIKMLKRMIYSNVNASCGLMMLCCSLVSAPVSADTLFGGKFALMNLDQRSRDDLLNLALFACYEFDSMIADLSLIGEVSRSVVSGETGNTGDLDFESESAYVLWKTTRSLFVTLRAGVVRNKFVTRASTERSDGMLLGGSVGIVIGRTRLQIEYTRLADDANFIGIGLQI